MGTEVVFVLILPVALICVVAAIGFWLAVARAETGGGYTRAYLALIAGFAVSLAGLALLTYLERSANFTWLVEHGYYTEAQRAVYLPARVVGQAILNLVFVLPAICFVAVPLTARLARTSHLTLGAIGLRVMIAWLVVSLAGWLWNLISLVPPYSLPVFLRSTAIPTLVYGLPIPIAALLFLPRKRQE